jgi:hypothetical protein
MPRRREGFRDLLIFRVTGKLTHPYMSMAHVPKWGTLGRAQDRPSDDRGNDIWMRSRLFFANPVCAGFYPFVVQLHLQFCNAIELNLGLSQRP